MVVEDLITDAAVEIVFNNTNFGSRTPREMIAKCLRQVSDGFHVGYTMQCCLMELGLIFKINGYQEYVVSPIGKKYLELLTPSPDNQ